MSAPETGRQYVFVSYASANRARVIDIVDILEAEGVATWFDRSDIPGGTSYGPEIVSGIKNATAILLMCSESSLASRNVRQEIQLSWRHERPILPILLEPLVFPDDVSYWLEGAQWIEILDQPVDVWLDQVRRALTLTGYGGLASWSSTADVSPLVVELPSNNLPDSSMPLLGRERELRHLSSLLSHSRIITLTGTGGSGKTRLAEQAARDNSVRFPDGIWFIDAAAASNALELTEEIAATLGVQEIPGTSLIDAISTSLRGKQVLLLVDNLEQVAGSASVVEALVAIDGPVALLTSRAPVKAPQEVAVPVSPLEAPAFDADTPASTIARNPAVQLFVDRAKRVKSDFQLSDGNAYEVASICTRLDGLPLAIELAAAKSRLLHPAAILSRLDSRLSLLNRGSARSARQQTLYSTISWSYDLLDPVVQAVFRRFGVFVRGATFETTETVISTVDELVPADAVLDAIDDLIDHSLLEVDRSHNDPESTRIRMLETIREFALWALTEAGDSVTTHGAHAENFRDLSAIWIRDLETGHQSAALSHLASDQGNILAAIEHFRQSETLNGHEQAVELAASLWRYWWMKGSFSEGRRVIDSALEGYDDQVTPARAAALNASGILAFSLGGLDEARQLHTVAADIAQELGLTEELARAFDSLGIVEIVTGNIDLSIEHFTAALESHRQAGNQRAVAVTLSNLVASNTSAGNFELAEKLAYESLDVRRKSGDQQAICQSLMQLGVVELNSKRYAEARDHLEQAMAIAESIGDIANLATALANLGSATEMLGDFDEAGRLFERSQKLYRDVEDVSRIAYLDYMLGHQARSVGNSDQAWELLFRAVEALAAIGQRDAVALCLETFAGLSIERGNAQHAAWYFGAAKRIRAEIGIPLPETRTEEYAADVAAAIAVIGESQFEVLAEEGRTIDLLQLIEESKLNLGLSPE